MRQVTQENRGKRTPGVDGVAALTAKQRLRLAGTLRRLTGWTVAPIRRVYIPKPNNPNEKRGLGILQRHLSETQVRSGRRHRKMLRPHIARHAARQTPRSTAGNAPRARLAESGGSRQRRLVHLRHFDLL